MSDRPSIDERLDRVAGLLETSTQQIAYLSELIVSNSQAAAERDAAFNAKLDRIAEEAAQRDATLNAKLDRLVEVSTQQSNAIAAIDARLDRIAQAAEQQTQAIATLTHQMGVMTETLTRVDLQLERLGTLLENQSRISAEQAATTAALVRLVTVLTERSA